MKSTLKSRGKKVSLNSNDIFERRKLTIEIGKNEDFRGLSIPDTHFPFHSEKRLKEIYKFIKEWKPTLIVQHGDLTDQYSFSRFDQIQGINSQEEIEEGIELAKDMWKTITKLSPSSVKLQIIGNHDMRCLNRIRNKDDKFEFVVKKWATPEYTFPGVITVGDYGSEAMLRFHLKNENHPYRDVYLLHGVYSGDKSHMNRYGESVVRAHSHSGGCSVKPQHSGKHLFELDCGCVIDEHSKAFDYVKSISKGWIPGFGVVFKKFGLIQKHRYDL